MIGLGCNSVGRIFARHTQALGSMPTGHKTKCGSTCRNPSTEWAEVEDNFKAILG